MKALTWSKKEKLVALIGCKLCVCWLALERKAKQKHMQSIMMQVSMVSTMYAKTYHENKSS